MAFRAGRFTCVVGHIRESHFIQRRQIIFVFWYVCYKRATGSGHIKAHEQIHIGHVIIVAAKIQVTPMVCSTKVGIRRCISTPIGLG